MSYISEGKELIERTINKRKTIISRYDLSKVEQGKLDGEPYAEELRQLDKKVSAELRALRKKYLNWKEEFIIDDFYSWHDDVEIVDEE